MQKHPRTRTVLCTPALVVAALLSVTLPAMARSAQEAATPQLEIVSPEDYASAHCDSAAGDLCFKSHCPACGGSYGVGQSTFSFLLTDAAVQAASHGYGQCTILDLNAFVTLNQSQVGNLGGIDLTNSGNPSQVFLFTPGGSCGSSLNANFNDESSTSANTCPASGNVEMRSGDPLSDFDGDRVDATWTLGVNNNGPSTGSVADFGFVASLSCAIKPVPPSTCTPNATTVCLNNNRFKVTMVYQAPSQPAGNGHGTALTSDTAWFWFFQSTNVEAVIKVLNGCSYNNRYWVFAGGLTNVHVVITVEDTVAHVTHTFTNPQNTAFQPIQDTFAFATCP